MPKKPCPKGIECLAICESGTGYLLGTIVSSTQEYTLGRCNQCQLLKVHEPELGYLDICCIHLLMHLGDGHVYSDQEMILFADNRFTSVPLADYLLRNHIYMVGTLRARRFIPKNILKPNKRKKKAAEDETPKTKKTKKTPSTVSAGSQVVDLMTSAGPNLASQLKRGEALFRFLHNPRMMIVTWMGPF